MHMADALLSPAVGGIMWGATGATILYCANKIKNNPDDRRIPLMGVMGAFIFTAQMVNFAIPGTGSSGHLGGGLLLAILLGPEAAFLTLASVLTIQALFFADGGLLALGCNIFNLGFGPCLVSYPLIYQRIAGGRITSGRLLFGATAAAIIGLQLGALGVVVETWLSGMLSLSLASFLLLMQLIHLPIGIIEGLITAGVMAFIWRNRPEIIAKNGADPASGGGRIRKILLGFGLAAILTGGVLSWYSARSPDGLDWAIRQTVVEEELRRPAAGIKLPLEKLQERTAILPDYNLADHKLSGDNPAGAEPGTTIAGLVGGLLALLAGLFIGLVLKKMGRGHGRQDR